MRAARRVSRVKADLPGARDESHHGPRNCNGSKRRPSPDDGKLTCWAAPPAFRRRPNGP